MALGGSPGGGWPKTGDLLAAARGQGPSEGSSTGPLLTSPIDQHPLAPRDLRSVHQCRDPHWRAWRRATLLRTPTSCAWRSRRLGGPCARARCPWVACWSTGRAAPSRREAATPQTARATPRGVGVTSGGVRACGSVVRARSRSIAARSACSSFAQTTSKDVARKRIPLASIASVVWLVARIASREALHCVAMLRNERSMALRHLSAAEWLESGQSRAWVETCPKLFESGTELADFSGCCPTCDRTSAQNRPQPAGFRVRHRSKSIGQMWPIPGQTWPKLAGFGPNSAPKSVEIARDSVKSGPTSVRLRPGFNEFWAMLVQM